jgi:hypothetical protein
MSYLIPRDFNKIIQQDNLNQVIGSDTSVLFSAELTAIAEAKSYLVQKYDTSQELIDTPKWDNSVTYKAGARVYLDAPVYSTIAYSVGVIVTYVGNEYKCKTAITVPGVWDATNWTLLCPQYQIFYVNYPYPRFNYQSIYSRNDQIFYNGYVWTSISDSFGYDHQSYLQLGNTTGQPYNNTFPDAEHGSQYWTRGAAYLLPAAVDIMDVRWIMGDNRDQQLVTYIIDIALYHVHSRIAPRNIPDLRVKRYDDAVKWLKMCAKGDVTAEMPVIQPRSGGRVRFGGNVKQINSY